VDGNSVFVASLLPFFGAVVQNTPRPSFQWKIRSDGLSITASEFSVAPANVTVWVATTTDGYRDFRLYNCRSGPSQNCTHYEGQPTGKPGFPAGHAVPYLGTLLRPSAAGNLAYVGTVPQPRPGQ
jgi:hypothetical protein